MTQPTWTWLFALVAANIVSLAIGPDYKADPRRRSAGQHVPTNSEKRRADHWDWRLDTGYPHPDWVVESERLEGAHGEKMLNGKAWREEP